MDHDHSDCSIPEIQFKLNPPIHCEKYIKPGSLRQREQFPVLLAS